VSATAPTVAILTFGCRVNQADSQRLERDLRASGSTLGPAEAADIVVINTCAVTSVAEQAARYAIRRVARHNPAARIVVTGCYATAQAEALRSLPGVFRVLNNEQKDTLVSRLCDAPDGVCDAGDRDRAADISRAPMAAPTPGALGRTMCTLRVQTGCDEPCSYCLVPYTRGPSRSTPPAEVIHEIEGARDAGFREIMLTGVHLGSYGRDLDPAVTLADLLRQIADVGGDLLVRVGSVEPMDVSPAVEEILLGSSSSRFAPHLHLPLQHASNRVLGAMRRPYDIESYARLVDRIRDRTAAASIGTDLIVGFPGEGEEDFETLVSYLSVSPLSYAHVFPYSARPGTDAAVLPDHVPAPLIRARAGRLLRAAAELRRRFVASQVGSVRSALTIDVGSSVVTDNYLKLRIPPGHARNERVKVRIVDATRAEVIRTTLGSGLQSRQNA
jgi:threonylcarbamoyladenosine tRNA methylthiotransferase MtaB